MLTQESGRLIKAQSARNMGTKVAFNYDDLRQKCDEHIALAQQEAQRLISEARARVEEVRQQAHREGYTAGQRAGLEASHDLIDSRAEEIAAVKVQDRLRTILPAVQEAVIELQRERDRWLAAWESAAVRLAAAMAEKIVRSELQNRPELAAGTIREALQLAAGAPDINVRLHPEDLRQLQAFGGEIVQRLSAVGRGTLVPDERISRGGCVIETRHGVIDAQVETQLERMTQEMLESA